MQVPLCMRHPLRTLLMCAFGIRCERRGVRQHANVAAGAGKPLPMRQGLRFSCWAPLGGAAASVAGSWGRWRAARRLERGAKVCGIQAARVGMASSSPWMHSISRLRVGFDRVWSALAQPWAASTDILFCSTRFGHVATRFGQASTAWPASTKSRLCAAKPGVVSTAPWPGPVFD